MRSSDSTPQTEPETKGIGPQSSLLSESEEEDAKDDTLVPIPEQGSTADAASGGSQPGPKSSPKQCLPETLASDVNVETADQESASVSRTCEKLPSPQLERSDLKEPEVQADDLRVGLAFSSELASERHLSSPAAECVDEESEVEVGDANQEPLLASATNDEVEGTTSEPSTANGRSFHGEGEKTVTPRVERTPPSSAEGCLDVAPEAEATSNSGGPRSADSDAATSPLNSPMTIRGDPTTPNLERASDSGDSNPRTSVSREPVNIASETSAARAELPLADSVHTGIVRTESVDQPRENTPEYRPLRHHHGRRREPTPPPVIRVPQHSPRSAGAASPPPIEPPVTRSNCGYLKLQLVEGDYSATVLVPQCTLGDSEKLEEESAIQLGPPTPTEERLAQNSMPPVRQLHPALHTKLSRITGPTMLQPYANDMSPARERTASTDTERWHVFILEASEGSIEYERSTRRLSTRSSLFRTPEPNRDRGIMSAPTPGSRRKRSLSAVTETSVHLSTSKRPPPTASTVEPATSPLRRSTRLRGTSQAPSEISDTPEQPKGTPGGGSRRVTRAMKAMETAVSSSVAAVPVDSEETDPASLKPASALEASSDCVPQDVPQTVGTRRRKRKLDATADDDQDEDVVGGAERHHNEPPKRGFGWSFRRWFGR